MKRTSIITALLIAFTLCFSWNAEAQKFSKMDVSPMDAAAYPSDYRNADKLIKIVYSRPQLKGREVAKLAPNGKVWRTGANEAAELTLYVDMKLGDTTVKAGTYTFYTIPGDNEWTAVISTDLNVWGSYFYNEANDVARITVPCSNDSDSVEAFSIAFDDSDKGVDMHLGWGTVRVTVPFTK
ncbi:MAG: DUF2911 domain-containing protein [Bacteroidota bacterium]